MSTKGLIHLKGNEDEHSRKVRAMTKGVHTQKAKVSQQIRRAKEYPESADKRLLELVRNPEASALDIRRLIETIRVDDLNKSEKLRLVSVTNDTHRTIFGNKTTIAVEKSTIDEIAERIKEFEKKK